MAGQVFGKTRYQLLYSPEERKHFDRSKTIEKYLKRKATASVASANTYRTALAAFAQYIREHRAEVGGSLV